MNRFLRKYLTKRNIASGCKLIGKLKILQKFLYEAVFIAIASQPKVSQCLNLLFDCLRTFSNVLT